ncbi:MAG: WYL domain-containing protein [Thermosynechococcaceae cyanobacterium MS004]|nr:WYL domain-containing protein [Thermosynechococcaceae cyanobacterium MS004]
MQDKPILCHVLIGAPGSGKTTLAQAWIQRDPSMVWVSTDDIRAELYGNAAQQLSWAEVEAAVTHKIQASIQAGRSVIYDATNAKRAWRLEFLKKYSSPSVDWMGWWLQVDEVECKRRNRLRDRQVPDWVIEDYHKTLNQFKPIESEGFIKVIALAQDCGIELQNTFDTINESLRHIPKIKAGRNNRKSKEELHRYSDFLDFERLMHLMALLIHYPGAGALRSQNPELLASALQIEVSNLPAYENEVDELNALLQKLHGNIYADREAITSNLEWLQKNGLVNSIYSENPIKWQKESETFDYRFSHRYSDWQNFERLMMIIKDFSFLPLYKSEEDEDFSKISVSERKIKLPISSCLWKIYSRFSKFKISLEFDKFEFWHIIFHCSYKFNISVLQAKFCSEYNQRHPQIFLTDNVLRQDINFCLNPYGIMTSSKTRNSYFLGTSILSIGDLKRIFHVIEAHKSLFEEFNNPIAYKSYNKLKSGLGSLGIDIKETYPTRIVMHQSITDPKLAPDLTLGLEQAESYIENSTVLRLFKLSRRGIHETDAPPDIKILPLQIAFHRIAWYLGYVVLEEGKNKDLLKFERIDRLSVVNTLESQSKTFQKSKLKQLIQLTKFSYSPFIGNSVIEQQNYLNKNEKHKAEIFVNLCFEEKVFEFIKMGSRRFPSLKASENNHLKGFLPKWTVEEDFEFTAWIVGFGHKVKVLEPQILAKRVEDKAKAIAAVYTQPSP